MSLSLTEMTIKGADFIISFIGFTVGTHEDTGFFVPFELQGNSGIFQPGVPPVLSDFSSAGKRAAM